MNESDLKNWKALVLITFALTVLSIVLHIVNYATSVPEDFLPPVTRVIIDRNVSSEAKPEFVGPPWRKL